MTARRAIAAAAAAGWLLLCAGGAPPAHAQLGETRREIARRFGPPVRHNARVRNHQIIGGPSIVGDVHVRDGCFVRIVYGRDRSVQAEFSRCEGTLADSQIEVILKTAGEGSEWKVTSGGDENLRFYRRVDGQALASWTGGPNGSLLISADDSGAPWKKLLLLDAQ